MVSKSHTTYYCEQCGLELYSKGRLCPDCANEVRNRKIFPKVKNLNKKPILENSGNSGKDSGRGQNNLLKQTEYLKSMINCQLGINESILDGTADEDIVDIYNKIIKQ